MDATPQTYTWAQFAAAVLALLPADANRLGPVQASIALWTRLGVLEIQNYVEYYRQRHETLYLASDFANEGYASSAAMVPGAIFNEAFLVILPCPNWQPEPADAAACHRGSPYQRCARSKFKSLDWNSRMRMVDDFRITAAGPLLAIDPTSSIFYIAPGIKDCQLVSVFWNGIKIDFNPDELTPFDEQMTLVVADYVKARISREVDKDLMLRESYQTDYLQGRSNLYLLAKQKRRINQ